MIKRAIVSGATGAVGMALLEELTARHIEVLVLCRAEGRFARIPQHPLITCKTCALTDLGTLPNDTGKSYDAFFHLAWNGTAGAARHDTALQLENVHTTLGAVDAAHRFGCRVFVGAGSQAEYGRHSHALTTTTPAYPESAYGMAKLAAGHFSRLLAELHQMRHVWVRILSVYGPYDSDGSLITNTTRLLLNGSTPTLTAGEQIWDYLYSRDAAKALYLLGDCGKHGIAYPLGSGHARPLRHYVEALRDAIEPSAALEFGQLPYSPAQVMHLRADISALRADTGWQPETDFAEGVRKTVQFVRESDRAHALCLATTN